MEHFPAKLWTVICAKEKNTIRMITRIRIDTGININL